MPSVTIEAAITALRAGAVVALPTETVYGLAVDALNPEAIAALFALKQRPEHKALPVAIADPAEMAQWASVVSPLAQQLAAEFWPGPLTLILPARTDIPATITQGQASIALRCPAESQLLAVIRGLGHGICLTSANLSGEKEAVTLASVRDYFGEMLPILESTAPMSTLPSTILDITASPFKILREGPITATQLQECIGNMNE